MSDEVRICISSPPDRERLVAEIFFSGQQWGEINQEGSALELEVYPRQDGQPWRISYNAVLSALQDARERLSGKKNQEADI